MSTPGVYRGREQVRAFMEEQFDIVWGGPPHVDIERAVDCGDDVLLFVGGVRAGRASLGWPACCSSARGARLPSFERAARALQRLPDVEAVRVLRMLAGA
jgi:hypothetical protein